jgi:hypothetical protein
MVARLRALRPAQSRSAARYGERSQTLGHELAHFLAQVYGVALPVGQEERLAERAANEPMDYPLLRAAWEARGQRAETLPLGETSEKGLSVDYPLDARGATWLTPWVAR